MHDLSAKLLQYIQSGYHIKQCLRKHNRRVIKLEASIFSIFKPNLTLTEEQYDKAMRSLISWLVSAQTDGHGVEICTSHYGHEWVELRNRQGKLKSKLALSVRAINSLKIALMDKAALIAQETSADTGGPAAQTAAANATAEFPRQLPRKPVLAPDAIPEQWR